MSTHGHRDNIMNTLVFFVNGVKVVDDRVDPEWTLLFYLRSKLQLCGTKLGCGEGGCGACTVMVSRVNRATGNVSHVAVNACLAPVCSLHGQAVTTVEGLGSSRDSPHAVQERLARSHGSQCGFCTPGIVMSMYALLRSQPRPGHGDLETALQGNLCRCTGYRPIIEGFKSFVEDWEVGRGLQNGVAGCCQNGDDGGGCCKKSSGDCCMSSTTKEITNNLITKSEFTPYDPSQEPIFPPELKLFANLDQESLVFRGERVTWYRPVTLDDLLALKTKFPSARIVVGNTEVGVEVKYKNCLYPVIIQPSYIQEITSVEVVDSGVKIGAAVTLSEVEACLQLEILKQPEYKTRVFKSIIEMLNWFAGKQIRNVAGIGGNIMTGSPISDLNPIFMAAGCTLEVKSQNNGIRNIKMDHKFFTGYRKNVLNPDEILLSITIPYTDKNKFFLAYKQAKRREDDIAIVNSAFNVTITPESNKIQDISLAFGGMAATTILATKTTEKLRGKEWDESTLELAFDSLLEELTLDPGAPGGMVKFRRSLTLGFFLKFFLTVQQQRGQAISESCESATKQLTNLRTKGSQYFEVVSENQELHDLVGRPVQHQSGLKHATGEAVYCDDTPLTAGELHLALVTSTRAHASLLGMDAGPALALPGVVAFFSAKDLTEKQNKAGVVVKDEEVFVSREVTCQGQVLGAVVAETRDLATRGAKLVRVDYGDLRPLVLTIEDAIAANSFFAVKPVQTLGDDVTGALGAAEHVLEGELHVGGQEHFYLETHSCRAVPTEDGGMELLSSTQAPTFVQESVAHMLGVPYNRVVCRAKRLGGGFGGKETKSIVLAGPVALAAHRLRRPVRCMLDRGEDMAITGGRNPFLGRYRVGYSSAGRISALDVKLFSNAGCSLDLSGAVMYHALSNVQNAYNIREVCVEGNVCRTNLPSNTAFRGFGNPQVMLMAENYLEDIATCLNMDPAEVRRLNLYSEGDVTFYGQPLQNCTVRRCWDECMAKSEYRERSARVDTFNRENRWKKRGISITPTAYGIGFELAFLNQAGALVHVYLDGSVLVTHGGVEMGQGLHTKMIQVASRALGVAEVDVHLSETSTDKVPNTTPTAASVSSDLNGMAVLNACSTLLERLSPYRAANPKGGWKEWVSAAYFDRVSLSATGFYATPDIGFDWETHVGKLYNYYTYGAACSEVEVDCLTGDHKVIRTDIVMDLGESINPAIDVGQIEGGFMQGYGMYTFEEIVYSPTGALLSRGPGTYKIPGFGDVPAEFNVSLLRGAPNPRAVYSSKAVGEPPVFLAGSVFFAIKAAVSSARADAGLHGIFRLDSPATAERIRTACADHITAKIPEAEPATFTPWSFEP